MDPRFHQVVRESIWNSKAAVFCSRFCTVHTPKKPGGGSYDEDDVDALRSLKKRKSDEDAAENLRKKEEEQDRAQRYNKLSKRWTTNGQNDKKGVYYVCRVTQNLNYDYDAIHEFFGAFKNDGDARLCHPSGGDACQYKEDHLERNESWAEMGYTEQAPDWYLGKNDPWVHGAYVTVERLSVYVPPDGTEPKYGLWRS